MAKLLGDHLKMHHYWLGPVLVGLAYYLAAWLGLKASIMSEGISIFWPANAIVLAALLSTTPRDWPAYMLGLIIAEIVNDLTSFHLIQAALFAATNLFEVTLAAVLLKAFAGLPFGFDRLRHVVLFGLCALVLACAAAALMGAAAYAVVVDDQLNYWDNWRIWWLGDSLGLLLMTPAVLGWARPHNDTWQRTLSAGCRAEAGALLLVTLAVGSWIFLQPEQAEHHSPANPMLLLPIVIWAAARFSIRGAAVINLLIALISIFGTVNRQGPFDALVQVEHVLRLQEYLATLALSSLALAALMQELRRQNARLRVLGRAVDAIQEGILIVDAESKDLPIVYANRGFTAITGYSVADVIGRKPDFLLDAGSDPLEINKIKEAVAHRQRTRCIVKTRDNQGDLFWNRITIDPVPGENGRVTHFIGVAERLSCEVCVEQMLDRAD